MGSILYHEERHDDREQDCEQRATPRRFTDATGGPGSMVRHGGRVPAWPSTRSDHGRDEFTTLTRRCPLAYPVGNSGRLWQGRCDGASIET